MAQALLCLTFFGLRSGVVDEGADEVEGEGGFGGIGEVVGEFDGVGEGGEVRELVEIFLWDLRVVAEDV